MTSTTVALDGAMLEKKPSIWQFSAAAGILAGVSMGLGFSLAWLVGLTDFNALLTLGAVITGRDGIGTWFAGLLLHLFLSGFIGLAYGALFNATGHSGRIFGAIVGAGHWVVVGLIMGLLPQIRVDEPAAGFFGTGFGGLSFVLILAFHLLYGAVVGELYERAERGLVIQRSDLSIGGSPLADSLGQGQRAFEQYKTQPRKTAV